MAPLDAQQNKRLRGAILEILNTRHQAQQTRLDHVALWHVMLDLRFDLGENDLLTLLQDLCDRRLIVFEETRDRRTNRVNVFKLQLTPAGRDLCEGTTANPAVNF
ncbi:MAG: hypothetical protein ACLQG3_14615 [Terracidiphilus sp.]